MEFLDKLSAVMEKLGGNGVFLTAGSKPNTMTASWGFVGVMWNKPIIVVPVRASRFTHGLIEEGGAFSVSAPLNESLNGLLAYFGSVSGRDVDKYAQKNITPVKCNKINTYIIPGSCCHFECKVIYKNYIVKERLDERIIRTMYGDNSFHTMFYGEIVDAYYT